MIPSFLIIGFISLIFGVPNCDALNFESKTEDKEKEDNKEKKLKFEEGENKENLSFDDYNLSTKRVMLEDEKDSKK